MNTSSSILANDDLAGDQEGSLVFVRIGQTFEINWNQQREENGAADPGPRRRTEYATAGEYR